MSLETPEAIGKAARILNDAKLDTLSPSISGLGKELDVLSLALHAIGDNSQVQNRLLDMRGIKGIVEHAEFVMRKIAEDETLSRLIHDRTCTENRYLNAFLPEAEGRRASNIVASIETSASELSTLKAALYPPRAATEEILPGMERNIPEKERFANVTRDLAALKKNLQQAPAQQR